jgi:OOP family OmpA-OmpF porin
MKKILTIAALAVASLASSAMAEGFYVNGNVGQSDISATSLDSHTDTSYGLAGGWQFNKNFAAELGYTNLGKYTGVGASAKAEALQASIVGSYELAPKVSVFGRLGVADTSLDVAGDQTYHKTSAVYGIGAQYQFTPKVAATLEFTQYDKFAGSESKLNNVAAGIKYSF